MIRMFIINIDTSFIDVLHSQIVSIIIMLILLKHDFNK